MCVHAPEEADRLPGSLAIRSGRLWCQEHTWRVVGSLFTVQRGLAGSWVADAGVLQERHWPLLEMEPSQGGILN